MIVEDIEQLKATTRGLINQWVAAVSKFFPSAGVSYRINKRWDRTYEHWSRYPQKGKKAKRLKAWSANS